MSTTGHIGVQLTNEESALYALAHCAEVHGGVIHADRYTPGRTNCTVIFPYHGVEIEAYAHVYDPA